MINTVSVGPPLMGAPDLRSAKPETDEDKVSQKSTFAEALERKISSKPEVKEGKMMKREDSSYEKPESEIKDKPPSLGISTKKTQLAREKEIQKFMDSFESEFGIPPTRLVEAMAQLKISDQQESPPETADQLMSLLPLDQEDQDRAKDMYLGFLFNLQTIEQTPRAPLAVPVNPENLMTAQVNEKFLAVQDKRQTLQSSLETMNEKFWMKTSAVPITAPIGLDTEVVSAQKALTIGDLLREQETAAEVSPETAIDPRVLDAPPSVEEIQTLTQEVDPQILEKMSPSDLQQIVKELRIAKLQDARNKDLSFNPDPSAAGIAASSQVLSKDKMQNKVTPENSLAVGKSGPSTLETVQRETLKPVTAGLNVAEQPAKISKEILQSQFSGMNSGQQDSGSQAKSNLKTGELDSKKKSGLSSDEITYGSAAGLSSLTPLKSETSLHGQAPLAPVTPQEKQENIQQIMNQAQYLVKKGGGEMKVKLSPEGLGDMHLKIMVENGKVNVQMSTETSEAKKLVESSMSDLKNSLSAHRLSVENVKIDVVNSTSTDVATRQDSNNLNSQGQFQGHKDTRQFWNQFQEQFGSRNQRDAFFEVPNIKGYGQKKRDALTPLTEAQRPRRADGRGSSIDVVA